jgi:hypothetical protein
VRKLALAAFSLLVPGSALAHPDHVSGGDYGLTHLLTDPFHLLLAIAVVGLVLAVRWRVRRPASVRRRL